MILLDRASQCNNWESKMKDWIVDSFDTSIGPLGQQIHFGVTEHPWHAVSGNRHEMLDIPWSGPIPMTESLGWKTLEELDRLLCPEGLILVWDEQELA